MSEKLLMQILEKVNTIEMKVSANEMKVNTIEMKVSANEMKVNTIEMKVSTIEIEFKQFKQALFEVHEMGLETNAIVKRIEIIQDQQHRIIDLLSTRSIEQEATLKRIK